MAASSLRPHNQNRNAGSYAEDASRLIKENMKCPVCLEVLLPPIYQCETGHNICYLCVDEVTECPLCKSDYGDTRNYFAEELVNSMTFPCKYEEYGCHQTFLGSQLKDHQAYCEYKPYRCPELACQEVVGVHQMAKHLDKHGFKVMKGDVHQASIEIIDDHFRRKTEYNPWRISAFEMEFYTVATRSRDGLWYFWAYGLGLQKSLKKYSCEIVLYSDEKQIMYRGAIQSLRNNPEDIMKNGNCLITTDDVIKSIRTNGRIKCQVYFIVGKNWDVARNAVCGTAKQTEKTSKVKCKKVKKKSRSSSEKVGSKTGTMLKGSKLSSQSSSLSQFVQQISRSTSSKSRGISINSSARSSPIDILKRELELNGNKVIGKFANMNNSKIGKITKLLANATTTRFPLTAIPDEENLFVERIRDTLRCPSCNEVIAPPVFQCLIGHNVCHKCRLARHDCALCLSPLTDCRNFFAEELLYKTCQRCLYSKYGCLVCLPTAQMKSHEAVCDFAPFECPFNVCRALLRADDLLEHMKTHQVTTVDRELKNEVFIPRSAPGSAICIIPNILTIDKVPFYPIIVRDSDGNWLFYVISLNYPKYRFELFIKRQTKTLAFQGPVLSIRTSQTTVKLNGNALVVTDRAVKGLKINDKLTYHIKVKRIESFEAGNTKTFSLPASWVLTPNSKTELYANQKTSLSPNDDSEEEDDSTSVMHRDARDLAHTSDTENDMSDANDSDFETRSPSATSLVTTGDERESDYETTSVRTPTGRAHTPDEIFGTSQRLASSSNNVRTLNLAESFSGENDNLPERSNANSTILTLTTDRCSAPSAALTLDKNNNIEPNGNRRISVSTESLATARNLPLHDGNADLGRKPSFNGPISILKGTESSLKRAEDYPSIQSLRIAGIEFGVESQSSSLIANPLNMYRKCSKKGKRSRSSSKHRVRMSDQVIRCGSNDSIQSDINGNDCCCESQTNLQTSSRTNVSAVPSKHAMPVQCQEAKEAEESKDETEDEFYHLKKACSNHGATVALMEDNDLLTAKGFNEMTEAVLSSSYDVVKSVIGLFTSDCAEKTEESKETVASKGKTENE